MMGGNLSNLGNVYWYLGKFDKAIDYYIKSIRQVNEVIDSLDSIGVKVDAKPTYGTTSLEEYLSNKKTDVYNISSLAGLNLRLKNYELNKEFYFFVKFRYSTNKIHSKEFIKYIDFMFCRERDSVRYETFNEFLQNEPRFEYFVKSVLNG